MPSNGMIFQSFVQSKVDIPATFVSLEHCSSMCAYHVAMSTNAPVFPDGVHRCCFASASQHCRARAARHKAAVAEYM